MSHPDKTEEGHNLLTSWKEIAVYLGRDVRTCLRWEKNFGLPIHRLDPASEKSRVFAYRDELAEWLRHSKTSRAPVHGIHGQLSRRFLFFGLFSLIIGLAAILFFLVLRPGLGPREPVDFSIRGSSLIILNGEGRELWRHDTGLENLLDEKSYREHFQFRKINHIAHLPYLQIKDLNLDGRREVVFSIQTQDETKEGEVFCFDRRGRVLWQFKAGRQTRWGGQTYSGDYRIGGILAEDVYGDGSLEILLVAVHKPSWPCQFALLDSAGEVQGEYWNAGYFNDFACADLDGDGVKEIIAGGNNNEYGRSCLVVFKAAAIGGGSPQEKQEFRCSELAPGSELFYLLLPRTDVDLAENFPTDGVATIELLSNQRIQLKTDLTHLYYDFSFRLDSPELIMSHGFMQAHARALKEGKIKSALNHEYKANLLKGIRYWDGEKWSPEPVRSKSRNQG